MERTSSHGSTKPIIIEQKLEAQLLVWCILEFQSIRPYKFKSALFSV